MSSCPSSSNTHVLLCKGESNEDGYIKRLKNVHVDVTCLSLLQFKWKNLAQLADCLSRPHDYSGLILTSVRAIDAITECINTQLNGSSDILLPWREKNTFCVGPKTSTQAELKLQLKPSLPDDMPAGNVCSLIESIVKSNILVSKSLLFPCSSISNTEGPALLESYQIKHQVIHVYDTQAVADAASKFNSIMQGTPASSEVIIVIFSPSNYKAIAEEVKSVLINREKKPRIIAIGPTTKSAIESDSIIVDSVMSKPSPEALCQLLLSETYSCQLKTDF